MTYRFGVFTFDDRTLTLLRSDRPVPLEPQPARALALLIEHAGEVVTREQLRARLWDAGTHVDFDRGLAYCIGELRSALGDSADNPRFVQTLPRRGYTFIAPVTRTDAPGASLSGERVADAPSASLSGERPVQVTGWISAAAIAGVTLIVAAAGALMLARDRPAAQPHRPLVAVAG